MLGLDGWRFVLLLTWSALAGGCSSGSDEPVTTPEPEVGAVEVFVEMGGVTEGLSFGPPGASGEALYVTQPSGGLWRVDADRVVTEVAAIEGPVGVAATADGALLVCGEDAGEAVIWRVVPDSGESSVLVRGAPEPFGLTNFVAVMPDGRLVFTDSGADVVYAADGDGSGLEVVTDAISYPNGLALSADGRRLFVASWNTTTIYAIARDAAGTFGEPIAYAEGIEAVDGLVALEGGDLLAVTSGSGLVRIGVDGTSEPFAVSSALRLPANGATGVGAFSERWLYLTSLLSRELLRVRLDAPGVPLPVR